MKIVAADIGGTHARFAIAEVAGGKWLDLGAPVTLKSADYDGIEAAWATLPAAFGAALPDAAAIAVAAPIEGDVLAFVNNDWEIRRTGLSDRLGLKAMTLLNDFGAMAHGVAALGHGATEHLCGPDVLLPLDHPVSVIGPGTGLGSAILLRRGGRIDVVETESAHIAFAPLDTVEEAMMPALRQMYGRVSNERLVSGPGLAAIRAALDPQAPPMSDAGLWAAALSGGDAAFDRFAMIYGAVAGDIALAHGAMGVAIVGGLSNRSKARLRASGFHDRFIDKGRYAARMERIPVRLVTHEHTGLVGAAAAFAQEHTA
ncbi:glucokinase [Sphingosinicella soli]|uniref:Glucokinase n=1 Tax=Sphingosinicella soli TaxID=333708 RepID=A0A7W7F7M3_9SPHN|nr:glucokinase [Sphingosinicella soli]MBB4633591.1 glucokinase [Sphingosinicella soli]